MAPYWYGNKFPKYWIFVRVTCRSFWWFHSQRPTNVVIWDAMTLMWLHCNNNALYRHSHKISNDLLYPPLQRSWKGGILVSPCPSVRLSVCLFVCLSVCGWNRVRSVSSTILIGSISYLHILSSNFRRCFACNACFEIQKLEFLKFVTLTLSSFDLGSNMTQWYG